MRNLLTRGATLLAVFTLVIAGAAPTAASGNRYVEISASGYHTCALTAQGKAYCWGSNDSGRLGSRIVGASNNRGPQAVVGRHKFMSISAGEEHTCALTKQGQAYCWGSNYAGQLGDGTTNNSDANGPQAVIGGLTFASLSAGDYFTCGITSVGRAYCWGANYGGTLGDGTTNYTSGINGPQVVIGGLTFASISAGDDHVCALTPQGQAYCWGANFSGELGDGTTDYSNDNGPQPVIGGLTFASISVSRDSGSNHSCAITVGGKAYCWGANGNGQLGDGTRNSSRANGPQAVIGGLTFASISAGEDHTCARTARGKAYCWGANGNGQLGDGTLDDASDLGPQTVKGHLKFASISGGNYFTCALTAIGEAYCWGANGNGQLGDGSTRDSAQKGPQAVQ